MELLLQWAGWALLISGLVAIAVIDLKTLRIPDALSLPLLAAGLGFGWLEGDVASRLAGAAAGYLFLLAVEVGFRLATGRDGLGRGDAKLLAVGGAWCGLVALPGIVLIAAGAGLVLALITGRTRGQPIPFGPFLALGIIIAYALT